MSDMHGVYPNKSYEGWETIDDDSQEFEPAVNLFQKQQQKGASEQAKHAGLQWEKRVHIEEHQHYDIVIESPGVKDEHRKALVYDDVDEATENQNVESTEKFATAAREKLEKKKATADSSDD